MALKLFVTVADPRGGGGGGLYILSEKQCPICLRLHEKTSGNKKFPGGRAPRPLHSKIFF